MELALYEMTNVVDLYVHVCISIVTMVADVLISQPQRLRQKVIVRNDVATSKQLNHGRRG